MASFGWILQRCKKLVRSVKIGLHWEAKISCFADLKRLHPCLSNTVRLQPSASEDTRRPEDLSGPGPDDLDGARWVGSLSELPHLEAEVRAAAPRLKLFAIFLGNLKHEKYIFKLYRYCTIFSKYVRN